ncbi:splicing regulator ARVCF-like isoform X2 [Styela clava]
MDNPVFISSITCNDVPLDLGIGKLCKGKYSFADLLQNEQRYAGFNNCAFEWDEATSDDGYCSTETKSVFSLSSASQITEDIDGTIHSQPKLVDNTLQVFHNEPTDNRSGNSMNADAYYSPNGDSYVSERTQTREAYQDPLITTETVVGDDGVERTITKKTVTKTVTTHTTRQIEDYEHGSLPRSDLSRPQDSYRSQQSPTYSDRNHRSPTNEESRLLKEPSSESSSNSDLRPGSHDAPVGYTRHMENNYDQRDEPRQLTPEKFQPEEYGLEDERRSDYEDDNDGYGLDPVGRRDYDGESSRSSTPRHRQSPRYDPAAELRNETPIAAPRNPPRAPRAEMETGSQASLDRLGHPSDWRRPELKEVIRMLSYPIDVVQLNAAAYLQHLCFNDNNIKANVRRLDGIPPLVRLLDHANPKVQLNACGALRNLCYGPQNNDNKIAIKTCEGVPALVRVVRECKDPDVKEQATGTLWNLSAHKDLKGQILELAMEPLATFVIIPYSGWQEQQSTKPKKVDLPDILTNALGIIRNLSSHNSPEYRKRLRGCDDLIDAIVYYLRMNIEKEETANKGTENSACILRNLSFQLYIEAPGAEQYKIEDETKEPEQADVSCFGKKKSKAEEGETIDQIPPADSNARGHEILWQPDVVSLYLSLLNTCVNQPETLEAAAGAVQNLTHGNWQWALYARAVVRKEKGLPVLVDRLRTDNDRVIRAVSIALTNLAQDHKNKDLIGKYAMRDLAYKLPGSTESQTALSDLTYIAVLNTVRVIVERSATNARHLREAGGIERITTVNNSRDGKYHQRVVKAAGQVLKVLWDIKELHSMYKKDGWNKTHFVPTVTAATLPRSQKALNNRPYDDAVESGTFPRRKQGNNEEYAMNEKNKSAVNSEQNEGPTDSWV